MSSTVTAPVEPPRPLNINEASKACGLSPSVLRIWELRYGWPTPKRKSNGYRAYLPHQVEELKRVADLVKNGMTISAIIIDGMPRWPANLTRAHQPRGLPATKALPMPGDGAVAKLHEEIVRELEVRRGAAVLELLQRASFLVRPADEARTSLLPVVHGLHEWSSLERPMEEDAAIRLAVARRAHQLIRLQSGRGIGITVVPVAGGDAALAAVTAALLANRGFRSCVAEPGEKPVGAWLLAGSEGSPSVGALGRVSALAADGATSLAQLANPEHALPWAGEGRRRIAG